MTSVVGSDAVTFTNLSREALYAITVEKPEQSNIVIL